MAQLSCKNLSFAYDGETVLSDINFSIEAGSYLCIVGENGSGKSTLMKGLLGLKSPVTGAVEFGDGLKQTEIGYLPQQTQIQRDFPASVFEVVLSGRINGMGKRLFFSAEDKAAALANMERLGIEDLKERCYMELSGGQQQRVMLARVLVNAPELLILDEPTVGIDGDSVDNLMHILHNLNMEKRVTVLMVTHELGLLAPYINRVLCISDHSLAEEALPETMVIHAHQHKHGTSKNHQHIHCASCEHVHGTEDCGCGHEHHHGHDHEHRHEQGECVNCEHKDKTEGMS